MNDKTAERNSNKKRFAAMSQDQLIATARDWNDKRILRAAGDCSNYRMINSDGELTNINTGATYNAEDVRRWDALPGVVMYIGCDCDDERYRLAPLREAMQAARCGSAVTCKHGFMRLLHDGAQLRTSNGIRVKLRKGGKP